MSGPCLVGFEFVFQSGGPETIKNLFLVSKWGRMHPPVSDFEAWDVISWHFSMLFLNYFSRFYVFLHFQHFKLSGCPETLKNRPGDPKYIALHKKTSILTPEGPFHSILVRRVCPEHRFRIPDKWKPNFSWLHWLESSGKYFENHLQSWFFPQICCQA